MRSRFEPGEEEYLGGLVSYDTSEHFGRVVCGEPTACAYEWIVAYAASLVPEGEMDYDNEPHEPVTTQELIDAALEKGDSWGSYIQRGGLFEGMSPDPMLFEKLSVLTGKSVPYTHFFSCAC